MFIILLFSALSRPSNPRTCTTKLTGSSSSSCSQTPEPAQQAHRFIIILFSALSKPSNPRTCTTNSQVIHNSETLRPQNLHNKLTGSSSSCSQPSANPPTPEPAQQTQVIHNSADPPTPEPAQQTHRSSTTQQTLRPQNLYNKLTGSCRASDPRTCTTNSQVYCHPLVLRPQNLHNKLTGHHPPVLRPQNLHNKLTGHHPPVLRPQNLHNKLTGHPQLSRPPDPRSCTTNSHVHHHPVLSPQQTLRPQNLHNKLTGSSSSCSQPSADPPTLEPAQQTHRFIILLLFSDPRTCTTNSQVHHPPDLSPQQTL